MSDPIVSGFRHFDFRLNSDRIVQSAMLLLAARGDFGILKNKRSNVGFASKGVTPFDSMVTMFITFSPKNHPSHLHLPTMLI